MVGVEITRQKIPFFFFKVLSLFQQGESKAYSLFYFPSNDSVQEPYYLVWLSHHIYEETEAPWC